MRKWTAILTAALAFAGCSTMHFDNGPERRGETRYADWHHVGVFSLVEFSDPVDLAEKCQGKQWSSVQVEEGFYQAVVDLFIGWAYSPWDVQYSCAPAARSK